MAAHHAAGSCSDSSAPSDGPRPSGELNVVRVAPASAPLYNPVDSFYAVRGDDREVRIYFQDDKGAPGEEYLRLRVDAPTLLARPDGSPFTTGDSVLILPSADLVQSQAESRERINRITGGGLPGVQQQAPPSGARAPGGR